MEKWQYQLFDAMFEELSLSFSSVEFFSGLPVEYARRMLKLIFIYLCEILIFIAISPIKSYNVLSVT